MVDYADLKTDCHFYENRKGKHRCAALCDFYAADKPGQMCGNCPFFKTDEEFEQQWGRRAEDDERRIKKAI